MRINMQPEVRAYLNRKHHDVLTVAADLECVGANCSEFKYPEIHYKQPDSRKADQFDRFDLDGITVFFDKQLETVPEVTLKLEHHLLADTIRIDGLGDLPKITHQKF